MNGATPFGPIACVASSASESTAACAGTGRREKRAIRTSGSLRGRYWEPIPTAIAASTPPVTSGDGSPQAVKSCVEDVPGVRERVRAEEDPREADDLEGDEALRCAAPAGRRALGPARAAGPPALGDERRPVDRPPRDERPPGPVPEPADEHRQHQVPVREEAASAVAAERDVDVVAEPARQRHVPAAPEVLDRGRGVRARRSSAGSGSRGAARSRSPCSCSRRSRRRSGRRMRRRRRAPRATSAGRVRRTPGRRCSRRGSSRSRPS